MHIRKAIKKDINTILKIFENGRRIQQETGNAGQWAEGYPTREMVEEDIQKARSYVCISDSHENKVEKGTILATMVLDFEPDPNYSYIEDGQWLNDESYAVIHRISSRGVVKGSGKYIFEWGINQYSNIRIDTRKENKPMLSLIKKYGFTYCGVIYVHDGTKRLAFQKVNN